MDILNFSHVDAVNGSAVFYYNHAEFCIHNIDVADYYEIAEACFNGTDWEGDNISVKDHYVRINLECKNIGYISFDIQSSSCGSAFMTAYNELVNEHYFQ